MKQQVILNYAFFSVWRKGHRQQQILSKPVPLLIFSCSSCREGHLFCTAVNESANLCYRYCNRKSNKG